MRVGLVTPDPGHPLLAAVAGLLMPEHEVTVVDPAGGGEVAAGLVPLADVYLLKSRTPQALSLAHGLERHGARVVNGAAATALLQDRTAMADRAQRAKLPFAPTRTYDSPAQLLTGEAVLSPVVVKSRRSAKGDVVVRVDDGVQLRALAGGWPAGPVVVQDFMPNDGWDHKVWVIEGRIFAARRRSELSEGEGRAPSRSEQLPPAWAELALRVGEVFEVEVYGVDLVEDAAGSPLIVDINAFPGIRDQPGAPEALVELILGRQAQSSRRG
ncbi:RimK family alpha-L-glutamate ligase [Streptomyces sp. NPDC051561]|uniref:RimK family alpha-L-glutamate ligase n=1 Tax=Streptomyces sp. NPDC051561 TaxID=3365658 RepID=UPI0037AA9963